jgi:hypothetical protein
MAFVRPFVVLAVALGTLFLLAQNLGLARLLDEVTSLPKAMMAFVGFSVCIVAILARLRRD